MVNEEDWMSELEREVSNWAKEREARAEIAQKYGQKLERRHMKMDLTRLEHHFAHKAVIEKTVPGKYSLSEAAKRLNLPIYHLNILRIRGMIKSEQIGRGYYFDLEVLKQELKSEGAVKFLTENYRLYSPE